MKLFPQDYANVRPGWLPDWSDPNAYENHGDQMLSWAWEFLRRNPEYQADYARWAALPDTDGEGSWSPKHELTMGDWTPMRFCAADPPALSDDETVGEYERRTGLWPELLHVGLCRKWKIDSLEDPAKSNDPGYWPEDDTDMPPYFLSFPDPIYDCGPRFKHVDTFTNERMTGRLMLAQWPKSLDQYVHACAIDLRYNVDDQLETLRWILKEIQVEAKARQPDDGLIGDPLTVINRPKTKNANVMLSDLRVLDAVWSGVEWSEIIRQLWGGPEKSHIPDGGKMESDNRNKLMQKIKDALIRVCHLVIDCGYQDMMRWGMLDRPAKNTTRKRKKAA